MKDGLPIIWDPKKAEANLEKHKIAFEEIASFDWSEAIEEEQIIDGEYRTLAFGPLGTRFMAAVVYQETDELVRLISLRRAERYEVEAYVKAKG